MTEPPGIRLASGEPGAVDPRLLASSEADCSAAVGEADRVGLGVLEREGRDDEVGESSGGELQGHKESMSTAHSSRRRK